MKNIYLIIMSKSAAPTELRHSDTPTFYKYFTPTELFAFSKIDTTVVSIFKTIKKKVVTNGTKPQRGKTFVNKYPLLHKSTISATHVTFFSKMDKSSVTNSILDLI